MDSLVRRRRRQRELLDNEDDEDDYFHRYEESPAAANNDFASLEAMLASQASNNTVQHQAEMMEPEIQQAPIEHEEDRRHQPQHHHRERAQHAPAPPSSPSTLSNDSLASPPKKEFKANDESRTARILEEPQKNVAKPAPFTSFLKPDNIQKHAPPKKKPTVAHTAKSIVGSRPMHWGAVLPNAPAASNQRKSKGGDPFFQSSSRKRKALLAAELNKATKARTHATARLHKQKIKPAPMTERETFFQAPKNDKELTDISFAPSFFSPDILPMQQQTEPIEPVQNNDNLVMQSPTPQQALPWRSPPLQPQQQRSWIASPVPTRKSKHMGPLMKRLKAIRSGMEGDAIRMQSGQYPFSVRSMDRNDPRNRATTVCNVTILGNPIAWGTDSVGEHKSFSAGHHHAANHHRLVSALSYVHSWTRPLVRSTSNGDSSGDDNMLGFVWAVFTYDKAREQTLGKGTQLRIYNAVGMTMVPPLGTDGKNSAGGVDVHRMLLCTNLCEPYPSSSLPPLPDVSGAIGLDS